LSRPCERTHTSTQIEILFIFIFFSASARMEPASARTHSCFYVDGARVRANVPRICANALGFARTGPVSVRTHLGPCGHAWVHVDATIYPLGNFKTDATVRLSHGWPNSHRHRPRPSILSSVLVHLLDNPSLYLQEHNCSLLVAQAPCPTLRKRSLRSRITLSRVWSADFSLSANEINAKRDDCIPRKSHVRHSWFATNRAENYNKQKLIKNAFVGVLTQTHD
jgi:hypothetical protein